MHRSSVRLVTISREFGAGGSDLARALGERLGWPVLDHDIVHRVAARLKLDDQAVERFDEHAPSLLARIATVLIVPTPDLYSPPETLQVPSHDAIAGATRRVMEAAAATLPLIVVGHGAQSVFGGRPDALHVRVVAPLEDRAARVAARLGVDAAHAAALAQRADHDRQAYFQRYFHHDWRSAHLYDLQVNTGGVPIAAAVAIVAHLIESRAAAPAGTA